MRQHFEKQIEDAKPLKDPSILKGKSIYSEYQVDDKILVFMEIKGIQGAEQTLIMCMITERELDKLEEEYEFVEMQRNFPVLRRKDK